MMNRRSANENEGSSHRSNHSTRRLVPNSSPGQPSAPRERGPRSSRRETSPARGRTPFFEDSPRPSRRNERRWSSRSRSPARRSGSEFGEEERREGRSEMANDIQREDRYSEMERQLAVTRRELERERAASSALMQNHRSLQQANMERGEQDRELAAGSANGPRGPKKKRKRHDQRKDDEADASDDEPLPTQAGKKFAVLYYMWGTRAQIFGTGGTLTSEEDEEYDENQAQPSEDAPVSSEGDAIGDLGANMTNEEGIDRTETKEGEDEYRKAMFNKFCRENPALSGGWRTESYQSQFMLGMSKIRSNMKVGIQDRPQEAFGLEINAIVFKRDVKDRSNVEEVKKLLKNKKFRDREYQADNDEEDAGNLVQMFRHRCIVSMLLRIYYGPSSVLSRKRSLMARNAYADKWNIAIVPIPMIAFAATLCRHILLGSEDLTRPTSSVPYYRKALVDLNLLQNNYPLTFKSLQSYFNEQLGFETKDTVESSDEEDNDTRGRLLKRRNGMIFTPNTSHV
ncbi:hypothetical protein FS842_008483 [Serendipita sp. 407]|nr:hypothetical protein FS842_008483 [Serendipita sp. 407]